MKHHNRIVLFTSFMPRDSLQFYYLILGFSPDDADRLKTTKRWVVLMKENLSSQCTPMSLDEYVWMCWISIGPFWPDLCAVLCWQSDQWGNSSKVIMEEIGDGGRTQRTLFNWVYFNAFVTDSCRPTTPSTLFKIDGTDCEGCPRILAAAALTSRDRSRASC